MHGFTITGRAGGLMLLSMILNNCISVYQNLPEFVGGGSLNGPRGGSGPGSGRGVGPSVGRPGLGP